MVVKCKCKNSFLSGGFERLVKKVKVEKIIEICLFVESNFFVLRKNNDVIVIRYRDELN